MVGLALVLATSTDVGDKVLSLSKVLDLRRLGEGNVDEFRRELYMKHLYRQVLSPWVVKGDTSINTARYEQVAMWAICNL